MHRLVIFARLNRPKCRRGDQHEEQGYKAPVAREKSDACIGSSEHEVARLKVTLPATGGGGAIFSARIIAAAAPENNLYS